MTIAQRLMAILIEKDVQQSELAKYLDVSATVISNWKSRNTDPPSKFILPICDFLHVNPVYLLTGEQAQEESDTSLTKDDAKALGYYHRLSEESQDYIKGEMIRLYKEEQTTGGRKAKTGTS